MEQVVENELFEESEQEIPAEELYHAYDIIDREKSRKNSLSWNNKSQEDLLDSWAENAASYKWMHIKAARYYDFINDIITIPVIVLSSLSAMGAVFVISNNEGETIDRANQIIEYIFAGANLIIATLSSVQKYKRFGEISEKHRVAAVEYSKFYREIKLELVLDPKARKYAIDYSKNIKMAYDKLLSSSPDIPEHISKGFEKIKDQPYCKTFIQTNASIPFCL